MEYPKAYELYKFFLKRLSPACERIEVVGSVKRGDPKVIIKGVHDLEFLLIPKITVESRDLFGAALDEGSFQLDNIIEDLKSDNIISDPKYIRKANGARFKKFAIIDHEYEELETHIMRDFCLELYIVTARTWAIQNVIRTGPSAFSQRFVTSEKETCFHRASGKTYRGLLPNYYQYIEGETVIKIRNSGEILDLSEENDAIGLLGLGEIPPDKRYMYI